jgi:hypothetical protein
MSEPKYRPIDCPICTQTILNHDDVMKLNTGQQALELLRSMADNWENSGEDMRYVTTVVFPVGWYNEIKALLKEADGERL